METLDIKGLPEDKVSYLQKLIEQWRAEEARNHIRPDENEPIVFATHSSDVIGPLTRREIYDHL